MSTWPPTGRASAFPPRLEPLFPRLYTGAVRKTPLFVSRRLALALLGSSLLVAPAEAFSTGSDNTGRPAVHPAARSAIPDTSSDAAARLAAGDSAGAIDACAPALAAEGAASACRLISAAAHLERHEWEAARAALEPARGKLGVLEPWGALLLGEALAGAGKAGPALALLDEAAAADPDGPLGRRAEVPRALALAHAGQLGPARTQLESLLAARRGPPAELRFALARALEAAGDAGAAEQYLRVWREHPDAGEADRAAERLAALGRAPAASDRMDRVDRLVARGMARRALAELQPLLADPAGDRAALALLHARALSGADRKAEAEKALQPCLAKAAPKPVRLQALELAARLAMRRHGVDEALGHLRRLEAEATGAQAREAAFLAAFFLYDAGRFAQAEKAFRTYAARHGARSRGDEAAWYAAWSLYKQGKFAPAANELAALARRFPKSTLVPQSIYWQGRALERAGRKAEARKLYLQAIDREPLGWYALLARDRLGEKAPALALRPRPFALPAAMPEQPAAVQARLRRAVALYAAGLVDEGGAEVQAAIGDSRDGALLATAAELARHAGDHHRAFQLGLFKLGGIEGAADLAFPQAFAAEVDEAAARFGVDPHFVWSIMRQESGFRPGVRSAAAAVGLMQLLPVTARRIATLLERPEQDAERLTDPRVNVTFGTWYLRALLQRFGGSVALAAAAYNAGPPAVARWMVEPARKDLPLDEFVESIPYRETRHYVKRVVANLQTYRIVHGGAPLALDEKLPAPGDGVDF